VVVAHQRVDLLLELLQLWCVPHFAEGVETLVDVPASNDGVGLLDLACERIPDEEKTEPRLADHRLCRREVLCDVLFVGGIVQLSLLQKPPVVGAALVAHPVRGGGDTNDV
jgi:hypothetical protein